VIEAVQAQKLELLRKRLFAIGAGIWSLGEFAEEENQPGSPVEQSGLGSEFDGGSAGYGM